MGKTWLDELDNRQRMEMEFARQYATNYNHGTDGHSRLVLIAKMAELLDELQHELIVARRDDQSS